MPPPTPTPPTQPPRWFDAHLDLAYLAEAGRDMTLPAEHVTGPQLPAAATLHSLAEGHITAALGTIFIQKRIPHADPERTIDGPWTFSSPDEAHAAALRQLSIYETWHRENRIHLITRGADLAQPSDKQKLNLLILMEGAPGLRSPADLPLFHSRGVRALSLCWAEGTPYSGGNASTDDITPLGRDLVAELDRLSMIHDVSHLSDPAFWTLTKIAKRPLIASHSNCRALLPGNNPRHLSDDQIRAIADQGGIIGIVLFTKFLTTTGRATLSDILRHIDHIEKITKRRDCIALGSDLDGGFSANDLPTHLTHPRHLPNLAAALTNAGWSDTERSGFMYNNWANFFQRAL